MKGVAMVYYENPQTQTELRNNVFEECKSTIDMSALNDPYSFDMAWSSLIDHDLPHLYELPYEQASGHVSNPKFDVFNGLKKELKEYYTAVNHAVDDMKQGYITGLEFRMQVNSIHEDHVIPEMQKVKLDPKGNVVLMKNGEDALLYRGDQAVQPFVVARGYNPADGQWRHGRYYSDLADAADAISAEIIESATIRWTREEVSVALKEQGVLASEENINAVIDTFVSDWRDPAILDGNEALADAAASVAFKQRMEHENPTIQKQEHQPAMAGVNDAFREFFSSGHVDPKTIEKVDMDGIINEIKDTKPKSKHTIANLGKEAKEHIKHGGDGPAGAAVRARKPR